MQYEIRSDNGPCFRQLFDSWCADNGIIHSVSSPYSHEKSAESACKDAKQILRKTDNYRDFQAALAAFNMAPRKDSFSPTDLLWGRSTRDNKLPMHKNAVNLELTDLQRRGAIARKKSLKKSLKYHFGKDLEILKIGDRVHMQNPLTKKWDQLGTIVQLSYLLLSK